MQSIAQYQYPMVVWRSEERFLWNPIHRKALRNRPEERVRLRIIEYLMQAGWSKHRITTEEAIQHYTQTGLRTDIICYSQDFAPRILIECKAESVSISGKTATQIARYNQEVQAPYVLMSNGLRDFWYQIDHENQHPEALSQSPDILPEPTALSHRPFDYWKERGFAGNKAEPALRRWLEETLLLFQDDSEAHSIQYLSFKRNPADLDLNHYYLLKAHDDYKVALSFLSTPFGGSRMAGIINQNGQNIAVIEINLDLIFENEHPNTSIYSAEGIQNVDIQKESSIPFEDLAGLQETDFSSELLDLWKRISE